MHSRRASSLIWAIVLVATVAAYWIAARPSRTAPHIPIVVAPVLDRAALESQIASMLQQHPGEYGVYVKVLETDEEFVINDSTFPVASCFKLPLSLCVYEMVAADQLELDAEVAYLKTDWEAGTGVLQATKPGTEFTVRRLVELAVVESDNIAANMLLRTVTRQRLIEFYQEAGARVIPASDNITSPSDMGLFASRLITFAQKQPELGKELLTRFLGTKFKDRIPAGVPDTVPVANKIGTWPGTANDVGLVVADKVTYIIAVLSRDVGDTDRAAEVQVMTAGLSHPLRSGDGASKNLTGHQCIDSCRPANLVNLHVLLRPMGDLKQARAVGEGRHAQ